jgi:hypothetical protein
LTTVIAAIGRCLDSAQQETSGYEQQETSGYDQLTCSLALIGVRPQII